MTYYTPDYQVTETDILAAFRMTPQPGVPAEECGAAVAAESSTGTWTTVWTDGLTQLDRYKGRCYGCVVTIIWAILCVIDIINTLLKTHNRVSLNQWIKSGDLYIC